jgi:hypothetical protein
MIPKNRPHAPTTNRNVAIVIACVLLLATLYEEYRNGTVSIGVASSVKAIRGGYANATFGDRGWGYDDDDDDDNATTTVDGRRRKRMAHFVFVENRDLETDKSYGYYTMAMWRLYVELVPDVSLLVYNSSGICPGGEMGGFNVICRGYNGTRMSPYWPKVSAMLHAMDDADANDLLVFVDADMQLTNNDGHENFTRSIFELDEIRHFLESGKSMMVINEAGSFWGFGTVEIYKPDDMGKNVTRLYRAPIVSNFFVVINNAVGRRMMEVWWQSMAHPTKMDPSGEAFLWGWPWEQERLTAYYDAAPDLFYVVDQSWFYFYWIVHGPFCCIGFEQKYDIIRSVNETMMDQVRVNNVSEWNGTSFEGMVRDLRGRIHVRPLVDIEMEPIAINDPSFEMHHLGYFWNASSPPYYSFTNDSFLG